ncbi:hypothetical protein E2542_SST00377 [Spatholobus suberectus]|nr:hypothetical protein E2542_SST00377 [Spatholobus suberectus]
MHSGSPLNLFVFFSLVFGALLIALFLCVCVCCFQSLTLFFRVNPFPSPLYFSRVGLAASAATVPRYVM